MSTIQDLREMEIYMESIKKKLHSFRYRAPVLFDFVVSPMAITMTVAGSKSFEISINYDENIKDQIRRVRDHLRDNFYPRMTSKRTVFVEPSSQEMKNLIDKEDLTFEEAFDRLSKKEIVSNYLIDKIDTSMNRIIVLNDDDREEPFERYDVDIPVIVFLQKLRGFEDPEDKWTVFSEHCTKDVKGI